MKENDYYTDTRIKQFAKDYSVLLAIHFKNVIDTCYNHSFDIYKRKRIDYAKLLEEAKKKNFEKLDTEMLSKLKKLRKEFTSRFALPKRLKLTVYDKDTKKNINIPFTILKSHVSKHFRSLFKIKRHGRDKYSGWQFKDYYVVDYNRIDELKKLAEEKKEDNMTKAEKKAIYDKAANGQLGCTPEYVIKQIKKKERAKKRREETVAKKAVQASFEEFAKLKAENEQLKAEIAKLKQLKDLNSDIPSESIDNSELEKLKADADMWRKIDSDPFACEQHYNEVLSRMPPAEDEEEDDIVVDQAMQAQLDQIRQLQSEINYGYNYDNIADQLAEEAVSELKGIAPKQQLHPDNDIPDVPPEPAHVKPPADDIPDKEPTYPSKVLYRLAEFVKKCYINPNAASRLATMYGESQTFKSPKVECDLVAAIQSNVKQRLFILKAAHKELLGKLNKKDLDWLVSNINKTQKELNTIN